MVIFKRYRVSRDLFLSEGGKWIRVVYQVCLTIPVLCLFSHSAFPNSSRFLKAIRHYRICQLRSSKRFSGIAVHRKLYKNISSYLICQVPSYSAFSPVAFRNPRATPRPFSSFESGTSILSNKSRLTINLTRQISILFLSSERK